MGRIGLVAVLAFVVLSNGHGQAPKKVDEPKPDVLKTKALMKKKLEHAQKILEALATNDPAMAAEQAQALIFVRREAAFRVLKTKDYDIWANDFELEAEGIIKASKSKNMEVARNKYLSMTMTCFNCHNYVRDQGMVKLAPFADPLANAD